MNGHKQFMKTIKIWPFLLIGITLLAGLMIFTLPHAVFGDTSHVSALFLEADQPDSKQIESELASEAVLQAKQFEVNWDALKNGRAQRLALNLFDDQVVTAVRDRRDQSMGASYVWVGHVEDKPYSHVSLSVVDNVLVGTISLSPVELYEISYSRGNIHLLRQLDLQWQHNSTIDDAVYPPETAVFDYTSDPAQAACDDDPGQIDVLVLYTADARIAQGGTAAIEAWINDRISQSNSANSNSLVAQQINLVHVAETDFIPSGNISQDLANLRSTDDIYLPEAHILRDTYAADMVALVIAEGNNDACGVGYTMSIPGSWFTNYAFSVTGLDYPGPSFCSSTTFTHELGHNHGNQHDHANSAGPGAYPYSHGYQAPNNDFRTLMAYNCTGGCPRINYWSNPDVSYQSQPTGIEYADDPNLAADNARSMVETAPIVANFRRACLQNPTPTATLPPTSSPTATTMPTNTPTPEPTQTSLPTVTQTSQPTATQTQQPPTATVTPTVTTTTTPPPATTTPTATAVVPRSYLYFFPAIFQ